MTAILERLSAVCARVWALEANPDTSDDDMDAARDEMAAWAGDVWAIPARTFDDVVDRALIARDLADKNDDGTLCLDGLCEQQRAFVELVNGVLALTEARNRFE